MAKEVPCGVCGDTAPGHKLYGSSNVCLKCRAFFRRSVQTQSEASFTCVSGSQCDNNKCRLAKNISCINCNPFSFPMSTNQSFVFINGNVLGAVDLTNVYQLE